jgi:hypothetical protein
MTHIPRHVFGALSVARHRHLLAETPVVVYRHPSSVSVACEQETKSLIYCMIHTFLLEPACPLVTGFGLGFAGVICIGDEIDMQ